MVVFRMVHQSTLVLFSVLFCQCSTHLFHLSRYDSAAAAGEIVHNFKKGDTFALASKAMNYHGARTGIVREVADQTKKKVPVLLFKSDGGTKETSLMHTNLIKTNNDASADGSAV